MNLAETNRSGRLTKTMSIYSYERILNVLLATTLSLSLSHTYIYMQTQQRTDIRHLGYRTSISSYAACLVHSRYEEDSLKVALRW